MTTVGLREFHSFEAAGREFLYLVPSAAVFELDAAAMAILARLRRGELAPVALVEELSAQFPPAELRETVNELMRVRAIGASGVPEPETPRQMPPANFPLTTMVLNVTNQCNLSCTYCYEYGEDKIVDTE